MDTVKTAREVAEEELLLQRGVRTPCPTCRGLGTRCYGSGATWRGGVGAAAMTIDRCDICWGSGDADNHWMDMRKMLQDRTHQTEEAAVSWLKHSCGFGPRTMGPFLTELLKVMEKQTRRRKLPEGLAPFWYQRTVEGIVSMIRTLSNAALRLEDK